MQARYALAPALGAPAPTRRARLLRQWNRYSPSALNVEPDLLREFIAIVERQNRVTADEPGQPRVEIAQTRAQLAVAAAIMARAFVGNRDKAWLAWLSARDIRRLSSGDADATERKTARVIRYLLAAALPGGGLVLLETAAEGAAGARVARGAALRSLPPASPGKEGLLHKYAFGAAAVLASYGLMGALAADRASCALRESTEAMKAREGIPPRCINNGMVAVSPDHWHKRVASRLCAPFHKLADRCGLQTVLQSSSPLDNDARVFAGMGFEKTGEHLYGVSKRNRAGPHVMTLMVRKPR
jgi:hypothetical protein